MTPQARGGLRRRLRRAVLAAGGIFTVSETTGISREQITRTLSYYQRPSDGEILILAACMFGVEMVQVVEAPSKWWWSPGGDA